MKIKIKRSLLQSFVFQILNEAKRNGKLKLTQFAMLYLLLKPGVGSGQIKDAMVEYRAGAAPKSYKAVQSHVSYFTTSGPMNIYGQRLPDGRYVLSMKGRRYIKEHNLLSKLDIVKPHLR